MKCVVMSVGSAVIVSGKCGYCLWEVQLLSVKCVVMSVGILSVGNWEVRLLSVKCVVMSVGSAVIVCEMCGYVCRKCGYCL